MTRKRQEESFALISPSDFETVARLLKQMAGIHLSPNKRAMVSGRLNKRLKRLGYASISSYCAALEAGHDADERDAFISALTTNMTRFNREAHHFRHFAQDVLPDLVATLRGGGRARVWSTGCSTGEEAYGLAFHVLAACPEAANLDFRILATDIDKSALATAQAGLYPVASMSQLSQDHASRFLDQTDPDSQTGMARISQSARDLIAFRRLNLNSDWPFHGKFDAIMCRNVAIYFDEETQARLWRRLTDRLQPRGVLYVGHSEALPKEVMARVGHEGVGTFRLSEGSSVTGSTAPPCLETTEKPDEFERQTSHSGG